MANYIIDGTLLTNIAAAIRSKKGVSTTYTPAAMANAINGLTAQVDTTGTEHNVTAADFTNVSISANTSHEAGIKIGSSTYLDLSKVVIIRCQISYYSGDGASLSYINVDQNTIRITAGDTDVRIASVAIDYLDLKIS